MSGLLLALAWI